MVMLERPQNERLVGTVPGHVAAADIAEISGLTELAAGALTGWPFALAKWEPEEVRRLGIRSTHRLRQSFAINGREQESHQDQGPSLGGGHYHCDTIAAIFRERVTSRTENAGGRR
jgi:hypothetical protein